MRADLIQLTVKYAKAVGGVRIAKTDHGTVVGILDGKAVDGRHAWFATYVPSKYQKDINYSSMGASIILPIDVARSVDVFAPLVEEAIVEDLTEEELDSKTAATKKPRLRQRVTILILDEMGRLLVSKEKGGWGFPGGGTDGGKVNEAAMREALEEVGYDMQDVRPLPSVGPVEFLWPEDFKKKQRAKGRDHDGWKNFVRIARVKKKDKKLYDVEGDGKKNLKFVPPQTLKTYFDAKAKKDGPWKTMDRQTCAAIDAVIALREEEKTAADTAYSAFADVLRAAGYSQ